LLASPAQSSLSGGSESQAEQQQHILHTDYLPDAPIYDYGRHNALVKRRDELLRIKELQDQNTRLEDGIQALEIST
jgi:hypothetical protein